LNYDSIFIFFEAFAAVYLLYNAIVGKGKAYSTENVEAGQEEIYCRKLRKIYLISGILITILTALDILITQSIITQRYIFFIAIGVLIAYLVYAMISLRKHMKKTPK
jgi:Mn2+/Fe2+ NRAMP family transporter